jgi:hypothetical protein
MRGPGKVPPASTVLPEMKENKKLLTEENEITYGRSKPSGEISLLTIGKSVVGPIAARTPRAVERARRVVTNMIYYACVVRVECTNAAATVLLVANSVTVLYLLKDMQFQIRVECL